MNSFHGFAELRAPLDFNLTEAMDLVQKVLTYGRVAWPAPAAASI